MDDYTGAEPDPTGEQAVYLIPEFEFLGEAQRRLPEVFIHVFELTLAGWIDDERVWPKDRSLAVRKKWFKVEMHTVIEDLCGDSLLSDDWEWLAGRHRTRR